MRRAAHGRGAGVGLNRGTGAGTAVVAALAIAGCGGGGHPRSSSATAAAVPPTSPAGSTRRGPPVSPALARLRVELNGVLRKAGPGSSAYVYDLTDRSSLFTLRDGVMRPPASVEKLYTTIALLSELAPNARLHTTVEGAGHLGPGGVWHGDLYLRGGGDPTLGDGAFNRVWELGYGPTVSELVGQLKSAGIHRVTGKVIGDGSLFASSPGGPASGYASDISDYGGELGALTYDHGSTTGTLGPAAFAARQLARSLRAAHVGAVATPATRPAPPDTQRLASVSSPPLSVLLKLMDVPSDDLFADLFTEQLGARFGAGGSIPAGAGVISRVIDLYGVHPRIVDGSGLSRADHSSPREVVGLLRAIWRTPVGNVVWDSLPVVGVDGTVRRIGVRTPAQGRCVAKTGTLDNVTNLAGYCHSRGHRTIAFALFIDGPNNAVGTQLLGTMVGAIANY